MSLIQITLDHQVLTYQMERNAFTDHWLQTLLKKSQLSWSQVQDLWVYDHDRVSEAREQLIEICAGMGVSHRDLNQLHQQFQQQEELGSGTALWRRVNALIHLVENQHNQGAQIKFYLDHQEPLPQIPESLRPYWQHQSSNGDLCLGYHTIGKTLWHCCRDHDPWVVQQGLLRPQQTISTELLMFFGQSDRLSNSQKHQQIQQWLRDNQLEDSVDLRDPCHQYHGQPLLARLIDPDPQHWQQWLRGPMVVQRLQILPIT